MMMAMVVIIVFYFFSIYRSLACMSILLLSPPTHDIPRKRSASGLLTYLYFFLN